MNPPPPLRAAAALTLGMLSVLVNACQSQPAPVLDYACYSSCGPGDGYPRAGYLLSKSVYPDAAVSWIVCASPSCPSDYGCVTFALAVDPDSGYCGTCQLLCHTDADCGDAGEATYFASVEPGVFCQMPAPGAPAGEGYCVSNPPFVIGSAVTTSVCNGAQTQ